MKITRTNINEKWSKIEKHLSDQIKKSSASYLEMARDWDTLSKEFTKEELDETKALLDNFIAKVNEQVEAGIKAEGKKDDTPKTITTKAKNKITRENINNKWPEIEKYLSDQIKKSSASYLEMARDWDTLSKEFTKEELDETKALLDNFIAKVNEQVEAGIKAETPETKDEKPSFEVKDVDYTVENIKWISMDKIPYKRCLEEAATPEGDGWRRSDVHINKEIRLKSEKDFEAYCDGQLDDFCEFIINDGREGRMTGIDDKLKAAIEQQFGKNSKFLRFPYTVMWLNQIAVYVNNKLKLVITPHGYSYARQKHIPDSKTTINTKRTYDWWHENFDKEVVEKINKDCGGNFKPEIPDIKKPEKPVKPKYKVGDFVITTDSKEHDAYYKIIKIDTDKTIYLVAIFDIKTNEPRVAESPITFTTAGLKKYTPKPYVPKVAEAPAWLKTLRSFVNIVGKEKPVSSIRKLVLDIQDRFDAKRGKHTNHIELIREIQDKLIPYANKKADKKVTLPEWKDLTDRCKVAIKSVSVSTKLSKDDVTSIELSGHRK